MTLLLLTEKGVMKGSAYTLLTVTFAMAAPVIFMVSTLTEGFDL